MLCDEIDVRVWQLATPNWQETLTTRNVPFASRVVDAFLTRVHYNFYVLKTKTQPFLHLFSLFSQKENEPRIINI